MASTPPLRHCVPLSVRNLELIHLAGEDGNYRYARVHYRYGDSSPQMNSLKHEAGERTYP